MAKLLFTKMNGAGNDFVMIDNRKGVVSEAPEEYALALTSRTKFIGADGMILIERGEGVDFAMRYFNSDGSYGAMCGNGARCAVRFAQIVGAISGTRAKFSALGETYKAELWENGRVRIHMPEPKRFLFNLVLPVGNAKILAHYVDVGSQHVVVFVQDTPFVLLEKIPLEEYGPLIRSHAELGPRGANVNFAEIVKSDTIRLRTYERGVEGETLACGTGAVSSAMVAHSMYNVDRPVKVLTKNNDELIVDFDVVAGHVQNLSLTGPTEVMFTGEIEYPR